MRGKQAFWVRCTCVGLTLGLLGCGSEAPSAKAGAGVSTPSAEDPSTEAPVPWTGMLGYSPQELSVTDSATESPGQTAPPLRTGRKVSVDCSHGGPGMLKAIEAASPGDTLRVTGRCSDHPRELVKDITIVQVDTAETSTSPSNGSSGSSVERKAEEAPRSPSIPQQPTGSWPVGPQ